MKLFLTIILLGTACVGDEGEELCAPFVPSSYDMYEFPIVPGTPEWGMFTTGQEMIDACQVPEGTLEQMTLQGLVETCLNYPLLGNMFAFTNIQKGMERQMENFNGFHELQTRNNAARLVLDRFQIMKPDCLPKGSGTAIGQFSLELIEIGMLLSQDVFLEQMDPTVRRELMNESLKKYDLFLLDQVNYGIMNLKVAAFTMTKVMLIEEYTPFLEEVAQNESLRIFIAELDIKNNMETLKTIIAYASDF